jgi:hypothetical protein
MFKRIRKWITIDNCVDLAVDIILIIWEVVTSPVLIVMRLIRHFIGEWFTEKIKACVRWIVHWFARKRAERLEKGQGIFRTYWYLILPSPFIIIAIWMITMISIGIGQGYDELKTTKPDSTLLQIFEDN